jgi:ADP-heptose:LPS heptosyltransferase
MHIATAVQRNVVAIFGSTVREFGFFPYKGNAVVLERPGLYCRPCSHIGRSECPEDHFRCMREIGTEEVYAAARRMLAPGDSAAGGIN